MEFLDSSHAKELSEISLRIWREHYPSIMGSEQGEQMANTRHSEEAIKG
jgi:hypothetical protein